MDFPRLRFQQAGAGPDDLDRLQAAFDALPEAAQASRLEQWAATSQYDLAHVVDASRQHEGVDGTLEGPPVVDGASEGEGAQPGSEPGALLGVVDPPDAGQGEVQAEDEKAAQAAGQSGASDSSTSDEAPEPEAHTVEVAIGADGTGWTELPSTPVASVSDVQIVTGSGSVSVGVVADDPQSACINVTGAPASTEVTVSYQTAA